MTANKTPRIRLFGYPPRKALEVLEFGWLLLHRHLTAVTITLFLLVNRLLSRSYCVFYLAFNKDYPNVPV